MAPAPALPSRAARMMERPAGFTLVELLVVISIIALLIALLLPSLAGARDQSRAVICRSNMRQVVLAQTYYAADDHKGQLPGTATHPRGLDWCGKNNNLLQGVPPPFNGPPYNGLLWRYISKVELVFECPTEKRQANQLFSYTMPHNMGGAKIDLQSPFFYRKNPELGSQSDLLQIPPPTLMEEDEVWYNQRIDDGAWANEDQITDRHKGTGNIGHLDGSVNPIRPAEGGQPDRIEVGDLDAWEFLFAAKQRKFSMGNYTTRFGWVNDPR